MNITTPNLIFIIMEIISFSVFIYVWYQYNGIQGKIKKYTRSYMMEPIGNSYNIKKIITIRDKKIDTFNYQDGNYILPKQNYLISGSDYKIYYEIGKFYPIWFKAIDSIYNASRLKGILKTDKIDKLLNSKLSKMYLLIIIGLIILFVILAGVSLYLYNQQSRQIIEMSLKLAQIYANSTKTGGGVIIP